jgi:hypothetical protein
VANFRFDFQFFQNKKIHAWCHFGAVPDVKCSTHYSLLFYAFSFKGGDLLTVIIALFWDGIRGHAGGVRAHDKAFLETFGRPAAFDAVVHWKWVRAASHLLLVARTAAGVVVDFASGPIRPVRPRWLG